ncbi:hypothetical protein OZK63_38055, partial [Streptomyces sp. UMAF16]|nr:hypothetical protein [Streptomyces sp. UMAF16]
MLVGSDDGGVDRDDPVEVAFGVGLGEQRGEDLLRPGWMWPGAVREFAVVMWRWACGGYFSTVMSVKLMAKASGSS